MPVAVECFGLVAGGVHCRCCGFDGFIGDPDDFGLLVHGGFERFDQGVGLELIVVCFLGDALVLVEVGP